MSTDENDQLIVIGWREWVALPDLGVPFVKAKIDTGARSSSLHAFDIETVKRDGQKFARFKMTPRQSNDDHVVEAEAEVLEVRSIRSSNGEVSKRPVIITHVEVLGNKWPIEVTLASRVEMDFRMLLGRDAIRGRYWVDSGRSFCGGRHQERTSRR